MWQQILTLTLEHELSLSWTRGKGYLKSSALLLCANNALPGGCVREQRHTGLWEKWREEGKRTSLVKASSFPPPAFETWPLKRQRKKTLIVKTFYSTFHRHNDLSCVANKTHGSSLDLFRDKLKRSNSELITVQTTGQSSKVQTVYTTKCNFY